MSKACIIMCYFFFLNTNMFCKTLNYNTGNKRYFNYLQSPSLEDSIKNHLERGSVFIYRPESRKMDMDSATFHLNKALKWSMSIDNQDLIHESLFYIGEVYFEKENHTKAVEILKEIIAYYQRTGQPTKEAKLWQTLGNRIFWKTPRNFEILQEAINYFDFARQIYKNLGLKEEEAYILKNIADGHINQGRLDLAERELLEVLVIYNQIGYNKLHFTYDLLADVYRLKGNLEQCLFYSMECVKSMEKDNDMGYAPPFYTQLAKVYSDLGNHYKSIEFLKKAAASLQSKENINSNSIYNHNYLYHLTEILSKELIEEKKYSEALAQIQNLIDEFPPKNITDRARIAGALAYYYKSTNQVELAENSYIKKIGLYEADTNNPYPIFLSKSYLELGKFYVERKNYYKAKINILKSLEFPKGIIELSQIKDAKLYLFKVDSSQGNYISAIRHFQDYKSLNDSIFNDKKIKQIEELQIIYDTEKKERELTGLKSDIDIQKIKASKAQSTTNMMLGILVLLLLTLGLLWRSYQLKQKNNRLLVSQKGEIDQKNSVLQKLIKEKECLNKEVHHRVKNNLQIVMSLLNSQSSATKNQEAFDAIQKSQHRLYAISLIHQKLYKNDDVRQIEMNSYIKDLIPNYRDSFDIQNRIKFDLQVDSIYLEEAQTVSVGLILNETITNAIKYGFPNNRKGVISITLTLDDNNNVFLQIMDNGIGLPENFDYSTTSLGMNLIKGLSKQLDGEAKFLNNNGLTVQIHFIKNKLITTDELWT